METKQYLDTCLKCLKGTNIPTYGRADLNPYEEVNEVELSFEQGEEENGI